MVKISKKIINLQINSMDNLRFKTTLNNGCFEIKDFWIEVNSIMQNMGIEEKHFEKLASKEEEILNEVYETLKGKVIDFLVDLDIKK